MIAGYINELTEGSHVDRAFALRAKEFRTARSGEPYLALELADRTGSIPAVFFRPPSSASAVPAGAVIRVAGSVSTYRGTRRMMIDALEPTADYDPADLLAHGPVSREQLLADLRALVASVSDAGMRAVLKAVFGEPSFLDTFLACPGAQSYHHAYIGGLAHHTISVARACRSLAATYPQVDSDLLVTAALLHDIGKTDELSWDTTIGYTDQGRLLGHVVLGAQRLCDAVSRAKVRVMPERLMFLEHALLSHHGELEWGSPKRPSTIEALLLHHVDNLDAKAAGFESLSSGAARADEVWTDASNLFRRPLYAPRAANDDRSRPAHEDGECLQSA